MQHTHPCNCPSTQAICKPVVSTAMQPQDGMFVPLASWLGLQST